MTFQMDFKWHGDDVGKKIKQKALEGIEEGCEFLLDEANKIVPHDEGILQKSGQTSIDRPKLTGAVSYDTPYARRLHEHPEYRFQKGRKGKWLEITFDSYLYEVFQHIAKKITF